MARKKPRKKTPRKSPPPDDFEIDWDLIKDVNNEEAQSTKANESSASSTILDDFFSFQGCDDEVTQDDGAAYNLTYEEKFDIFVDALAEDTDSEV